MLRMGINTKGYAMKRSILLCLVIMLTAATIDAGRKRPKAGQIKDNVYTDNDYGFEITIKDNWKAGVGEPKDLARLVLTQRNYSIPPRYQDAQDYTTVPQMVVCVVKSDMPATAFIDSLTDKNYKSDLKKDVVNNIEFLTEPDIVPKGKSRIEIAGAKGVIWQGQAKYMKEVQKSASSSTGERVYGNYGGAVYAFDHNGYLIIIGLICEWDFYDAILPEVDAMVKTMKFTDSKG
jgi:hypothetical protein